MDRSFTPLTKRELTKFAKEFPFLDMDCVVAANNPKSFKMSIKVSVSDKETLFIKPHFCLEPNYIVRHDNKYIGHVQPQCLLIDKHNQILREAQWDYDTNNFFIKDIIEQWYVQEIQYIVLFMEYRWWLHIEDAYEKNLDTNVGKFSHTERNVYIFKNPPQGLKSLVLSADLSINVPIHDLLQVFMAGYSKHPEAKKACDRLEAARDLLVEKTGKSLWKQINDCKQRGMSVKYGYDELMTYAIAGRIMLTFQRGADQFTMVGDESDYKRTGLQSLSGTVDIAVSMIEEFVQQFPNLVLQPNDKIGFG